MDKTFHEIQAKVAKRLIHSDRHRRRKSIAPDIVTCSSKNHDLSRLMVKNEVLFKNLEGKMSSIQQEQRRRRSELLRTEKALTASIASRKGLPNLTNQLSAQKNREKTTARRQPRRHSLVKDELSSTSSDQLVQKWLQSLGNASNTLQVPSLFDPATEPKNCCFEEETKPCFDSERSAVDLENHRNDTATQNVLLQDTSSFHSKEKANFS